MNSKPQMLESILAILYDVLMLINLFCCLWHVFHYNIYEQSIIYLTVHFKSVLQNGIMIRFSLTLTFYLNTINPIMYTMFANLESYIVVVVSKCVKSKMPNFHFFNDSLLPKIPPGECSFACMAPWYPYYTLHSFCKCLKMHLVY